MDVVWRGVGDAVDTHFPLFSIYAVRPLYDLIHSTGDVDAAPVNEGFEGLESPGCVVVTGDDDYWRDCREPPYCRIAQLLCIGSWARVVEQVSSDDYHIGSPIVSESDYLLNYLLLFI